MSSDVDASHSGRHAPVRGSLAEVARVAFKLGCIAFGGPAAHVGLMREEVVRRRHWIDDAYFLDLLGATNLIPGPNSTEMMIHVGYLRAGWRGLVVAGSLFILPAMAIVLAIAWAYDQFGTLPATSAFLYGVKPVIMAVVAQALWGLARTAVKSALLALFGVGALALALAGVNEVLLLFGGAALFFAVAQARRQLTARGASALVLPLPLLASLQVPLASAAATAPYSLAQMGLIFLKIGAILYGSGYVLLAFLRADFVERLGWLTDQQLLDAVAVGQFTPGPVFTTATFVGYLLGGWVGGVVATVAIFLPAFVFVAISNPILPRIRRSPVASLLLDGVNVVSLGLMGAVTLVLARSALVDPLTVALALAAGLLLIRYRVNSAWLVLGGGAIGLLTALL